MKKVMGVLFLMVAVAMSCGWEATSDLGGATPDASVADLGPVTSDTSMPDNPPPDLGQPDVGTDVPPICKPNCEGKICGDNGCGGECGKCGSIGCIEGSCVEGECKFALGNCDDNDPKTEDVCDGYSGYCEHPAKVCDDSNPCTVDSMDEAGNCLAVQIDCDDDNACTTDSCDPTTGTCGHVAKGCNDGVDYTSDSCDPATGACEHRLMSGTCLKDTDCSDGNACTEDVCDSLTHRCKLVEVICNDDGNKCGTKACVSEGTYAYCNWTPTDCDDGDARTEDMCDSATGACESKLWPGLCNTNDDCQDVQFCGEGDRGGGGFGDLGSRCLDFACPAPAQCWGYYVANHECGKFALEEGAMCSNGQCDGLGTCVPTPPTSCDDGDKFTEDWHSPSGCQHTEREFSFQCSIPANMAGAGRWCETWALWGGFNDVGLKADAYATGDKGVRIYARNICTSWWSSPTQVEVTARVFGPGMENGPWIGGAFVTMTDPAGKPVYLASVVHPWANPDNWGTVNGIAWCK